MAERVLRDHSEPCEHAPDDNDTDEDQRHYRYLTGHHRANGEWCPGGREVPINYEAAIELARTFRNLEWNHRAVRVVIDAALEET